ncbi:MAG: UvrD-helicase domain-containing protein [Ruminococcus sp.]|uniref:ATP-dependent helicase n=1 Tax=Ruminococcus sp. TaxID=41978 RepID=UPI0025E8EA9A|nr:UvrD-helicase domain-containing protein [Ruminococcus sp.]MBO4866988.1 UvrD-helicase domain-containing protein [Ruminococcus sp.]
MKDIDILKKQALERFFSRMNPMQQKAVFRVNGPLLILAGAGSGKTTVLINRIANMIHFGDAYNTTGQMFTDEESAFIEDYAEGRTDDGRKLAAIIGTMQVRPWNILAITFTNKAAGELKERIEKILGEEGRGIVAATFHSACVRILRRECANIGFTSSFAIYDTDDSKRVIKAAMRALDIDEKMFPVKTVMSEISHAKDSMITPEEFAKDAVGDFFKSSVAKVYKKYQQELLANNAMDFDDIICHTVTLFENCPDVLDHYQNLYKYIMVDEYQDTNRVQFRLVSLLSKKFGNICVVGDDDQSIYRFRGATIENILNFEEEFGCSADDVIKLEQNYRSTQNILTCANKLISNNVGRKGKNLWTDCGDGEKVIVHKSMNERDEASYIARTITENNDNGRRWGDHAVLYRMNAQSNALEQAMIKASIPYKIFGGLKFYERKEIKDILAYLGVIANHADTFRLQRIINEPKRGMGDATVRTVIQVSSDLGEDPIYVMEHSTEYVPLAKKSKALTEFAFMIDDLSELSEEASLPELLDAVVEKTSYGALMKQQGVEGEMRLENIAELKSTMAKYEEEAEEPSLDGFLEEVALYTDIDTLDETGDYVALMTMHAAKGLEFPVVFVAGMEDNVFPSSRSRDSESELEEERRLAYVAITRAKEQLHLVYAGERMIYGSTQYNRESQFIKELPAENIYKQVPKLDTKQTPRRSGDIPLGRQMAMYNAAKATSNEPAETYSVGEKVMHKKFGEGTIVGVTPMAGDTMLEIAFEKVGTKKIFANFAKPKKI